MDRFEQAANYHKRGFNCCQSVLAAFQDKTGFTEKQSVDVASGFGFGGGNGELCGAIAGAMMALSLMHPVDMNDPVASKKRTLVYTKEMQKRFLEKFGALRCEDLLHKKQMPEDPSLIANQMGITAHCTAMIVTAVQIVEELLAERE